MPPTEDEHRLMSPEERGVGFGTAMIHLYRGEMHRMTVLRQRLDVTTNWALLLAMGLTTFTLGSRDLPHYILLLGLAVLGFSIVLEARRYRQLHHATWRLAVLERGYFATLLRGPHATVRQRWLTALADDLENPRPTLGRFLSLCVRLRSNHLPILYFITAVWLTKVFIHPASPASAGEFMGRLAVGELIPPWLVAASATAFVLGASLLALRAPTVEALESWTRRGWLRLPDPFADDGEGTMSRPPS